MLPPTEAEAPGMTDVDRRFLLDVVATLDLVRELTPSGFSAACDYIAAEAREALGEEVRRLAGAAARSSEPVSAQAAA